MTYRKINAVTGAWAECESCSLHETRTKPVFWRGNPEARLMLIGEAPGEHEDLEGEPFVGRAGALLGSILESIGIEPWDCIIINTIGCRPPENRRPTPLEWRACSPRTYSLIVSVRPAAMVLLGATALTFLHGESKITQWRGKQLAVTIPWRTGNFKVAAVATYHPSYLLRCNDEKVKMAMTNDIRLGLELSSKSYLESGK